MPLTEEGAEVMRWIPGEEVLQLLTPLEAIAGVLDALEAERTKAAHGGLRRTYGSPELPLLIMPGQVPGALGLKAITLAEGNPERGLPTIQGLVVLFDSRDGHLVGGCDGPALTAARTGCELPPVPATTRVVAPRVATVAATPKMNVPRGTVETRLIALWAIGLAAICVATRSPAPNA